MNRFLAAVVPKRTQMICPKDSTTDYQTNSATIVSFSYILVGFISGNLQKCVFKHKISNSKLDASNSKKINKTINRCRPFFYK